VIALLYSESSCQFKSLNKPQLCSLTCKWHIWQLLLNVKGYKMSVLNLVMSVLSTNISAYLLAFNNVLLHELYDWHCSLLNRWGGLLERWLNERGRKGSKWWFWPFYWFVRSFIGGGGWLLAVFRRAFSLPPALRPRHGPVHNSPLTLRLVLYIYTA